MRIAPPTALLTALALATLVALPAEAQRRRPSDRGPTRGADGAARFRDRLAEGDAAPDFTLQELHGKKRVTLSSFKGKRPVALIFGSYT
jgi:hypothetical protein